MSTRKKISESNFLIVGLVRNCAEVLEKEIQRIQAAFVNAGSVNWLIIESDSSDETLTVLEKLEKSFSINYISYGELSNRFPKRTERLAYCRNKYIDEIRNNPNYVEIDYVSILDLDGVNSQLEASSVNACWDLEVDWDVCFANQASPYYDIWALRHKLWSPNDCWEYYKFLIESGFSATRASRVAVESRMIQVPRDAAPIQVDSAFGGLGIYKKNLLHESEYVGLNSNGDEICEHVSFHETLVAKGYQLFIVPTLINCGWNEHNLRLKFSKKLNSWLRRHLLDFVTRFVNKSKLKSILKTR